MFCYFLIQLQLDITELKSLGDSAQRNKVKDIISVAVRKLETDLVELRDQLKREEAAKSANDDAKVEPKKVEPAVKKVMESQLKDYCKSCP